MSAFALLLALVAQAPAGQSQPRPPQAEPGETSFSFRYQVPTAWELYVSCSLYAAGERLAQPLRGGAVGGRLSQLAPEICGLTAAPYLAPPRRDVPYARNLSICVPEQAPASQHRSTMIARAYSEYFEAHAADLARLSGELALRRALLARWPC